MKKFLITLAGLLVPFAAHAAPVSSVSAAQTETAKALIAVVPELGAEKDPLRKQAALDEVAVSLATLGRETEASSIPASDWAKLEVPHLVALSKLYSGDIEGARKMIVRVRFRLSRADLLLAISRELLKRQQAAQALPLVRQAEKYQDPKAEGAVYADIGLLLARCGDRTGAWQAFEKARQGAEATDKRLGAQPVHNTYTYIVPAMIRAGFVEPALRLAVKDTNTPVNAVVALQEIGATERAIQFAQSTPQAGPAVWQLESLFNNSVYRGQLSQARRILNLSRQRGRQGLTEQEASQAVFRWIYDYALLGDLATAYGMLNKVPELKKAGDFQFSLLVTAATSPVKDREVEHKRPEWLARTLEKLKVMPADAPGRFGALQPAQFLLTRGRKQDAMPFLDIADKSAGNLTGAQGALACIDLAKAWMKAGNPARARELAALAAQTADEPNASVIQIRLAESGFKTEAISMSERKALIPVTGDYGWRTLATEQSSIRPEPPAAWIKELKDPVAKAFALSGWATALVKSPEGVSMSGGELLPS